ncbi:MAG: peptidoglycan DD-metalloendopeptidase family protein [Candidatus Dormibacteraeota bacterium]|uniref:Peptidoglycan DD-metalloendopeptidase family protein n=1 Tax=Candidatus Amunia macphersoniae TaxID=3127014 RepID=A0A934KIF8_9BACT|nr:peptidoglycan DD-metalloendopeptidase family protein [Candidatus Dormibacteraeota bacterium]
MATPDLLSRGRATGGRAALAVVVTGAVIVTAVLGSNPHATADTFTDQIAARQQQLAADGASMDRLRAELAAAANQEAALQKAINDLDAQIAQTGAQVTAAHVQLDGIQAALSAAQDNLANTQAQLAADRRQLRLELVVIYKAHNASNSLSNFLNSGDFNRYWQHALDVNRLGRSERDLVGSVTLDEQRVQADVDSISVKKKQQLQLIATLNGIVRQQDAALASRQDAQRQLAAVQAQDQALLLQNEQAAAQLKAQIASLQAQEAAALAAGGGNGRFAWPETGPISQGFGCTDYPFEPYDPGCPSRHFHSGLDIVAACGTPLHAADSGIAHLYYGNTGYGDHVIIVHGNGWVSVYGHMSPNFGIGDGQTVHRGQVIGYEGSTGNSSGCHVHFEVDLNGTPKNPTNYLS